MNTKVIVLKDEKEKMLNELSLNLKELIKKKGHL